MAHGFPQVRSVQCCSRVVSKAKLFPRRWAASRAFSKTAIWQLSSPLLRVRCHELDGIDAADLKASEIPMNGEANGGLAALYGAACAIPAASPGATSNDVGPIHPMVFYKQMIGFRDWDASWCNLGLGAPAALLRINFEVGEEEHIVEMKRHSELAARGAIRIDFPSPRVRGREPRSDCALPAALTSPGARFRAPPQY